MTMMIKKRVMAHQKRVDRLAGLRAMLKVADMAAWDEARYAGVGDERMLAGEWRRPLQTTIDALRQSNILDHKRTTDLKYCRGS